MKNLGYYNGKYDLIENMFVPMNDRACFFGDGIYEAAYAKNHRVFALDEHIDRLFDSASVLDITVPHTKNELTDLICDLVKKVDGDELLVYFQVSRGTQMRNHTPKKGLIGNLWITVREQKMRSSYSPMTLMVLEDTRHAYCNMKTLNLLSAVIASQKALDACVDEAVLHRDGNVTECTHSNIFIITKNNELKTAPMSNMILPGVARAHLINAAKVLGISVIEEAFSLDEMFEANEVIVTASGALCRPVSRIDGKEVGGRAADLLEKLRKYVIDEFETYTSN
ncbi:MAG: aminotransferase class IV [Clostridia bacterium]|nr:aminotransferase class IV [Clostridia bacterium]